MSEVKKIDQAVMFVHLTTGNVRRLRVTRQKFPTLVRNVRKMKHFKYCKIFEILDYTKGGKHKLGNKIAFVTVSSDGFNLSGLNETPASQKYYREVILKN